MYVCSNNKVLCMYVIVCMYVVMYIHNIPILSTVHYYNTYTILFVYIVRTCISTVVCAKCKCGCIIILTTKWCMYFTHVFTHTLPCLCSTAPPSPSSSSSSSPSPSYAATCSLPSWLLIFIILSLVFFVITLFLSLFGVTRFETGIYMCT